jgi:endonuclease YncB( thermonuclease family)
MAKRILGALLCILLASCDDQAHERPGPFLRDLMPDTRSVLDGDTLLVEAKPVRLAGIDAPELGPKAKCWAEAALAGQAREQVIQMLGDGDWRLVGLAPHSNGTATARAIRLSDGEDLGDYLVTYGFAARTSEKWDWCGQSPNLRAAPQAGRYGPNLWWPTGEVFDQRAFD